MVQLIYVDLLITFTSNYTACILVHSGKKKIKKFISNFIYDANPQLMREISIFIEKYKIGPISVHVLKSDKYNLKMIRSFAKFIANQT